MRATGESFGSFSSFLQFLASCAPRADLGLPYRRCSGGGSGARPRFSSSPFGPRGVRLAAAPLRLGQARFFSGRRDSWRFLTPGPPHAGTYSRSRMADSPPSPREEVGMMLRLPLLALAAWTAILAPAAAADWPQWRGPKRDGASAETGLLKEWPKDGPRLLWRIDDVGRGYGSPSVAGDRICLISNDGPDDECLLALDLAGKRLWTAPIGKFGNPKQFPPYAGARSTPT